MEQILLCRELEDLIEQIGIVIRYESFDDPVVIQRSGLCIIKGKPVLFVEKGANTESKIKLFRECLTHQDLGGIYVKPAVREYLRKNP